VKRRLLLTGGAGFIGSHLVARLVGSRLVTVYDTFGRDALSGTELARHPDLAMIVGDVLDAEHLAHVARGHNAIVHLAAIAGIDDTQVSPAQTMRVNMLGTANMLEAAQATSKTLDHVIDFSTSEVFGKHAYRAEESGATQQGPVGEARWTYAVSKLAGEHLAHCYYAEYGLPVTSVRPFNVFGPGQVGEGAVHTFIDRALAGQDLVIHNGGGQIRAWCYVDDVVDAIVLILNNDLAVGKVLNIGNARAVVTIADLAERIVRLAKSSSRIVYDDQPTVDVELRVPNVGMARDLLGWEAKVDLDDGLLRTIQWYARNRERVAC
jgi:nucleoside-diphosphate-sugar epimerase